jgi:ABC-type transporter MlaC component
LLGLGSTRYPGRSGRFRTATRAAMKAFKRVFKPALKQAFKQTVVQVAVARLKPAAKAPAVGSR